jgi:hypothetical protein
MTKYQAMAAYAAALIERDMAPTMVDGSPSFGTDKDGNPVVSFYGVQVYSLLGAMRHAWDVLGGDPRAYSSLDRAVRAHLRADGRKPADLTQAEAVKVLLQVAKG